MKIQDDKIYYIAVSNAYSDDNIEKFVDNYFHRLQSRRYCEENKVCVVKCVFEEVWFQRLCITAKGDWVRKNCPEFVENDEYRIGEMHVHVVFDEHRDEKGRLHKDNYHIRFAEYCPKNFRCQYMTENERWGEQIH